MDQGEKERNRELNKEGGIERGRERKWERELEGPVGKFKIDRISFFLLCVT